jgi:hypothetical protein
LKQIKDWFTSHITMSYYPLVLYSNVSIMIVKEASGTGTGISYVAGGYRVLLYVIHNIIPRWSRKIQFSKRWIFIFFIDICDSLDHCIQRSENFMFRMLRGNLR